VLARALRDTDNKLRNNHKLIHEYFTHFLAHDQIVANFPVSLRGRKDCKD
jgi:hypothetical protein